MTELDLIAAWARAFAVTVLVETPLAAWLLTRSREKLTRRTAVAVIAQFVTHPIVWFVIPAFRLPHALSFGVSELWAAGAETAVYALTLPSAGFRMAATTSIVANAASVLVGMALRDARLV